MRASANLSNNAKRSNFDHLRVMVVDDDVDIIRIVECILRDIGVGRIIRAESGQKALEEYFLCPENIDVIICDLAMPGMSGFEVLEGVRSDSRKKPFIMLTANITSDAVVEAKKKGVTAYIVKPFTIEDIMKKMTIIFEALLEKGRVR